MHIITEIEIIPLACSLGEVSIDNLPRHPAHNNALTLFVLNKPFALTLHTTSPAASAAKERGAEVRLRGVVSAER
jgi:hypothetical protein